MMNAERRNELKVRIQETIPCKTFAVPVDVIDGVIPASVRYFKWAATFANDAKAFEWAIQFGQREAIRAQQER